MCPGRNASQSAISRKIVGQSSSGEAVSEEFHLKPPRHQLTNLSRIMTLNFSAFTIFCRDHNAPCLPPKFYITIVFNFSWVLQLSHEKSTTMVIFFFLFLTFFLSFLLFFPFFFFLGGGGGKGRGGERWVTFPLKITNNKFLCSYCNKKVALASWQWVFGHIYGPH